MSYVGHRFDLRLDGKPLRVVVVGRESEQPSGDRRGSAGAPMTLDERYREIHDESGLQRRYYTEQAHPGRNPHMRGTTSALRILFGRDLGTDFEGEWVKPSSGRRFHIFDGFALVNRLLCSAGPADTSQGRSTRKIRDNCLEHFEATLRILEPTILVLQGALVARSSATALPVVRERGEYLYVSEGPSGRVLVCRFSHPSAHGAQWWGDRLDSPYLTKVVAPTLRKAIAVQ